MNVKRRQPSGILVLHKAVDIIETVRSSRSGIALSDLARVLGIPKPTAYRILATLETRGYVARNRKGCYQMTRKFFDLENKEPDDQILARAAHPVIESLVASSRETVNLGILDAGEVVVIGSIESPQTIRMSSKIGNRRHLHSTALGKVLLSGLSDQEVLRLIRIKRLPRLTPNTLVTKQAVLAEIHKVREQGFAIDNEENEPDGRCIGAPILGPGGGVAAALSISAPVFRMEMTRIRRLAGELTEACRAISKAVAFPAESHAESA
jgi:DNA-binding IclR family transcriptional regulator